MTETARTTFETARRIAVERNLPSYLGWRSMLERRYTVMPPWYWNEALCRSSYVDYIRTASRPPADAA